ncbi:hypothetical protein [Aeromonas jandaei]|uniref:hypothetical protein n=1 Tax=Aeromonas jandaei TaxID=650 RepID=UPI002AA0E05A|nr:hypothetical protein [Aeromonas jandaei]
MSTTNIGELLINIVIFDKPNVLTGLHKTVCGEVVFEDWATMDNKPPAKRKGPPHSEIHAEQGKPITLPVTAGEP